MERLSIGNAMSTCHRFSLAFFATGTEWVFVTAEARRSSACNRLDESVMHVLQCICKPWPLVSASDVASGACPSSGSRAPEVSKPQCDTHSSVSIKISWAACNISLLRQSSAWVQVFSTCTAGAWICAVSLLRSLSACSPHS